jgi:hypothetical protein
MSMNPRLRKASDEEEDYEATLLSERQLDKRERESYKNNFLTKYIEKMEEFEEQQAASRQVLKTPKALTSKIPLAKAIKDSRTMEQATMPAKPRYKVPINAKVQS